jgi:hypothetical protein
MVACKYCSLEMTTGAGCTPEQIVIDGVGYEPVRHGHERGWTGRATARCGDCGALPGNVHHHGCDMERCPRCGRQSITCGCLWAGEERLAEEWVNAMEIGLGRNGPDPLGNLGS